MTSVVPRNASSPLKPLLIAVGCYLLFVVYGSLVPLDYHPRPFELAWRNFLATRYLALGARSRADWVANILLYIPLAYLLAAAFIPGSRSGGGRLFRMVAVLVFCAAVALGVEFVQLFFPPRTVSLNDILAEWIGSALGICIWLFWGGLLARLWAEMERGGRPAIRAAIVVYVLAYLAFGLFPYDFLVSAREFAEKFADGRHGLIVAPGACEQFSGCIGKVFAETIAVAPLGVLLGIVLGRRAPHAYAAAALCGVVLGSVLEIGQLFLASGVSEGISLLTRAAGITLGVALHRHVHLRSLPRLRPKIVPVLLLAVPAYLLALMWANTWFSAGWVGLERASANLDGVRWLPFYYHYFTTETHALRSLLACVAMYLPVGFGYWVWTQRPAHSVSRASALVPALVAGVLAFAMEMGKLFVPGKHPDPTDILIAMVAAAAAYLLAVRMHRWALQGEPVPQLAARSDSSEDFDRAATSSAGAARLLPSLVLLCGAGMAVLNYPLGGVWMMVALALYGAALWRYPDICMPAVLALLPLLDFAPWSGWILVNEFDLAMMVTLAVRLLRPPVATKHAALSAGAKWVIALLSFSFFVSAVIGLLPLSSFGPNAFASYYSNLNSLRHLKGFAWALALMPLLLEEARDPERMDRRWVAGLLAGLCGVVAVVLWERAAFSGLLDFVGEYRAEGTFPELHTGGGDVHAYLVMTIPFVVAWILLGPSAFRLVFGTALFVLASYALAVTFARGGYIGYAGAIGVLGFGVAVQWLRQRAWNVGRITVAGVLASAGLAVMMPIVSGSYMQSRLAGTQTEAATRVRHWARAIDMMDAGVTTAVFGMGLGTFPRTFLFKDRGAASATFSYGRDRGGGFVRLGSGRPLFLGQRVPVASGGNYTLALDLRSADPRAAVNVSLCEKSIQQSFRCKEFSFRAQGPATGWEHREVAFDSGQVGSGPWWLRRPVVLALANAQASSVVDVANVRLLDDAGTNLVANGDFSQGGARWFFSADDHLPWHIFNLWVQILFEQGWLGVLAVAVAIGMALARAAVAMWRGDVFATALLAALCGFLLVGVTESLFDGPRVTTLFFLLLLSGLFRLPRRVAASTHRVGVSPRGAGFAIDAEQLRAEVPDEQRRRHA